MAILGFNFNLLEQLTFYGSYHNNKWNQLIHFVFVPAIFWTVAVWLSYTPSLGGIDLPARLDFLPSWLASGAVLNGSAVGCIAYCAYYLTLDFVAGLSWGVCIAAPIWVTANLFRQAVAGAWGYALALHVLSWYIQIHPGHALLEGRRPALLDSFFQSMVLAPLFVWYELLFALGYRKRLHAELQLRVAANIKEWQAEQRQPLLAKGEAKGDRTAAAASAGAS